MLELSDTLKAPVAYAYRGKDVLEHDNPAAVGMIGLLGWGAATEALGKCDLMLMLGTDFPYRAFIPERVRRSSRSTTSRFTSGAARRSTSAWRATSARRCARCCRG